MFGGTTTKIAIYKGDDALYKETIRHSLDEMKQYKTVWEQSPIRRRDIVAWVEGKEHKMSEFDAIVCCSGLVKPCEAGRLRDKRRHGGGHEVRNYGIHTITPAVCFAMIWEWNSASQPSLLDPTTDVNMIPCPLFGLPQIERPNSYHVATTRRPRPFHC
jgi:butyrate kinase